MALIRIENISKRKEGGTCIVSATVAGEEVWFSSSDSDLVASPEAFLSAFLIVAQLSKDRLGCKQPVCKRWLKNSRKLLAITNGWWKSKTKRPLVPVHANGKRRKWFRKTALFFTCGVDSFYTLHHYPKRIHALVNVHGYDIALSNAARQKVASESLRAVAKARRIPLIEIRSNLREHSYFKSAKWDLSHGGAIAAAAHLLGGRYHDFVLSSSTRSGDTREWGSTWQFDRFWSSETVAFNSWGETLSRAEKAGLIAGEPLLKQHLRVCWQSKEPAANCGVCPKCTRTMVALEWSGKLDGLKQRFEEHPSLVDAVSSWKPLPIASPAELDPVLTEPGSLSGPLLEAVVAHRESLLADLTARQAPPPSTYRRILLPDSSYRELMRLSAGRRVFYHKVPGNVGDDLIHAATLQLFRRFSITTVNTLEEADQVVFCGGGNIGIWENCAEAREKIYAYCREHGIPAILYPQSVASAGEVIPDFVHPRMVREWKSIPLMPGCRLMPDMALAYHITKDYGKAIHPRGLFLRNDKEAMFPNHPDSIGDPPKLVKRNLDEYIRLAAAYEHILTDRLHFAIIGLMLKRKVTLLPNRYHKNRGMWETWLKDLGCAWADTPEETPSATPISSGPARSGLGMVICVHNEQLLLEANLLYHHAIGVDTVYLFLDRCTDRSEEIASRFPWVRIIHRNIPEPPYFCREHQSACMNDALEMAREDGLEWLLVIDADEFAFANNTPGKEGFAKKDRKLLREEFRESPNADRWIRANLKCLLRDVPPGIDQVILQTMEALPLALPDRKRFWEQEYFMTKGPYPGKIMDPNTREWRKMDRWLGHSLGKPIVRTSAHVEAYDPHSWTRWQNVSLPEFAWRFPIPSVRRGWHSHYYCVEPEVWLKKFRDIALQHEFWPSGMPMEFPKLQWGRASVNMSSADAAAYLAEGVQITRKTARQWVKKHPGVAHKPVWSKLLAELMLHRGDESGFEESTD